MNNSGAQKPAWAHEVRSRIPHVTYMAPGGAQRSLAEPQNAGTTPQSADPFKVK